jgi:transcription termination/antitermination protein NusG
LVLDTARWFAIWTHSHCEQLVHDQLASRGFRVFLPKASEWSRRGGTRRLLSRPMFTGYLFVNHSIDKRSYIEIVSTRGLVKILGERWDRLAPIPDEEIAAIQTLASSDFASQPYPFLREGQRARITEGPLAGLEGLFVRSRRNRRLLVLSVELLHRSVAVEVDDTAVEPLTPSTVRFPIKFLACV